MRVGPRLAPRWREEGRVVRKTAATGRTDEKWDRLDVILPTQLHAPAVLGDPERRLRLAVLEDAVHQFQRYVNGTFPHERARYDAELEWFASEDRSEPFAFESICDALNIDPEYVRSGLRRWRNGARIRLARFPRRVVSGPGVSIGR
jgi:hypothetical protein